MKVRNIEKEDIKVLSELAEYRKVLALIKKGATKLEWCFVIEDNNNFWGRIVYGVMDEQLIILDISFTYDNRGSQNELLKTSLKKMKSNGFNEVQCHLYSDRTNFQKYVNMLTENAFKITQEKKSFVWQEDGFNKLSKKLIFKSLSEVTFDEYIDVIEKVTEGTLDKDDLDCVRKFGSRKAAINYFNILKDIDFNAEWWKLAYTYSDELVGLVVPQKFDERVGAINYIGVLQEKRGNGYVKDLLIEGIRILNENGIKKIIGDIDVSNYPLEKALNNLDFKVDCRMLVLKLNLQ